MTCLVAAGDPSGDLLAAAILGEARRFLPPPARRFWGIGGPCLAAMGARLIDRIERFGTSGLSEAAVRLPRNAALLARLMAAAERRPPEVAVLVDYPDFNLVLGPALARLGTRIVYLLPPQVWAWRRGRLARMAAFVDAVAASFPFEVEIHRAAGMRAEFVGHPLLLTDPYRDPPGPAREGGAPVVAFLPGSRIHEVRNVLPAMAGAARLLIRRVPGIRCVLAPGPGVPPRVVRDAIGGGPRIPFDREPAAKALSGASAAVVHAGTATLEAALLGVPSIVVARTSRVTWEVARRLVRVPHVALPSIVLGRRVFEERLQDEVRPDAIARDLERLIADAGAGEATRRAGLELRRILSHEDPGRALARLMAGGRPGGPLPAARVLS